MWEKKEYRIVYDKYSNKLCIAEYLNDEVWHYIWKINRDDLFEILKWWGVRAWKRRKYVLVENEEWEMMFRKK